MTRVDIMRFPTVAEEIASGALNRVRCGACGHEGVIPEPIVVETPILAVGYLPVVLPSNRKKTVARRIERQLAGRTDCSRKTAICFGPRQLQKELPNLPWPGRIPAGWRRFDDPGGPDHRRHILERLIRARTDDAGLLSRLGAACYELKRFADARATLERATRLNPGDSEILRVLAAVELDDHRPEQALEYYDRVVSLTHEPTARFLAGVAGYRAGRTKAALERLRLVTSEQPDYLDALVWFAKVHASVGDKAAALDALKAAAERGLTNPKVIEQHAEFRALASDGAYRAILNAVRRPHGTKKTDSPRADRRHVDRGERGPARKTHEGRR
jgi:tetratricopeptide (TPR) repeat protein